MKPIKICRRCKHPVYPSEVSGYVYQCFYCDEDLYTFEVEDEIGASFFSDSSVSCDTPTKEEQPNG